MNNTNFKIFTPSDLPTEHQINQITHFLFTHLDEFGDSKEDIRKAIDYAMDEINKPGGFVITYSIDGEVKAATVVNKTGMEGYIPENILVYIAVHKDQRGKGIGKSLMQHALKFCTGDLALHVEPNNPAKFLYEKLGFENKYLEMRYKKSK
jgi:ribosomal protein S18 acetylase RimI-like enzyme